LLRLQSDVLVPHSLTALRRGCQKASKLRQEIAVLQEGLGLAYGGESVSERVISALNLSALGTNKDTPLDELGDQFIQNCIDGKVGHFDWWCDEWTQHLGKMASELMIYTHLARQVRQRLCCNGLSMHTATRCVHRLPRLRC
jgi:hypothetical protein